MGLEYAAGTVLGKQRTTIRVRPVVLPTGFSVDAVAFDVWAADGNYRRAWLTDKDCDTLVEIIRNCQLILREQGGR